MLEYLWGAASCFHDEGDPAAERWVRQKALAALAGQAGIVAAAIRGKATRRHLDTLARAKADTAATTCTASGTTWTTPPPWPKAGPSPPASSKAPADTSSRDRMDLTGARWGLPGAEAILKLRAIRANGDWADYWHYHLKQEHRRLHQCRYADGVIPTAQAA